MYLCTLRRLHPFVHALQHGDKIRVYARSSYPKWAITVEQGAVCAVHATKGELDHKKVHVVMNGGSETHPWDKITNNNEHTTMNGWCMNKTLFLMGFSFPS